MEKQNDFQVFLISRFLVILISMIMIEVLLMFVMTWVLIPMIESIQIDKTIRFIFLVFIILIFFIMPLVGAAFWFSKIVMDEVKRIDMQKEELRQSYEKRRNLMLSDIAHDLRTPITTILGYSKALNDGMVTSEHKKREYLQAIEDKSERINELITFLFEYIRLDSDSFSLKKEMCNLSELLRKCAASLYADVEEKGMEFHILIPEEPHMIELDAMQISRVITNLITNAIKHNEIGTEITLEMKVTADKIQVLVSDNGTPIPTLMSEQIFEPFVMGDASRQSAGGSGLGLSIAKKIVEMHGWKLQLYQNNAPYVKSFVVDIM